MPGKTQSFPSSRTTGWEGVRAVPRGKRGTDHPEIGCNKEDLGGVWEEGHAHAGLALVVILWEREALLHACQGFWVVAELLVEGFGERGVRDIYGV